MGDGFHAQPATGKLAIISIQGDSFRIDWNDTCAFSPKQRAQILAEFAKHALDYITESPISAAPPPSSPARPKLQ